MKLNEKEINLLIGAVTTGRFKGAKKGNRFVSEADVYKSFSKELRILEKPINITGVEKDFIKAFETKLSIDTPLMDEETLEVLYNEEPASEMFDEELKRQSVPTDKVAIYKKIFDRAFESYGATAHSMDVISRKSGTKLAVNMICDGYKFVIEFPFINDKMECKIKSQNSDGTMKENLYSFAYMPINLDKYISGKDTELKLTHPYQFLVISALKSVGSKLYSPEIFRAMVRKAKGGTISQLQKNIHNTMINAKKYSWSDANNTPVMWVDSNKSDLGKLLLQNNIQLNLTYSELLTVSGLKGIDLNTGSTSSPGKRCRVAKNYFVDRNNGDFILRKNPKATDEIFDIINSIKPAIYPCFSKTSAKRDNTATIKDTFNLVAPAGYTKRFTVK